MKNDSVRNPTLTVNEQHLLKEVASLPTSPFCESNVQEYVRDWADESGIGIEEDVVGNILLTYKGRGRAPKKTMGAAGAYGSSGV